MDEMNVSNEMTETIESSETSEPIETSEMIENNVSSITNENLPVESSYIEDSENTPKRRGRKPMSPEEKAQRAKERAELKKKNNSQSHTISRKGRNTILYYDKSVEEPLSKIIDEQLVSEFANKANANNNDEKQIISALIQGYVDGSIELEVRTILTIKKN